MEGNRIPKRVLYMNLGTRLRGRPRNIWQDEEREDGRIVGGEGWQDKVHNREEWKKLLRTARNRRILHIPLEWMNEWITVFKLSVKSKCVSNNFVCLWREQGNLKKKYVVASKKWDVVIRGRKESVSLSLSHIMSGTRGAKFSRL